MYLSSNFHRAVKFCICLQVFTSTKIFHFHDFSTVAQKCHGNFNLTHGNFNLLTAISIQFESRQFQFTHGNFNSIWLTAMSIYSRQRSRHFSLRSPPVNYGGRLGRTQTGMSLYRSPYISFQACVYMGPASKWTQTGLTSSRSLTRPELLSYGSETVPF